MAGWLQNGVAGAAQGAAAGTAFEPGIGTGIGAGAGLIASLVSSYLAYTDEEDAYKKAQEVLDTAQRAYGKIDGSSIRQAEAQVLGPTMLAKVHPDSTYTDAQREALASLKNISDRGGLTLTDRAVQEKALQRSAQEDRARQGLLMQNFAARGQGGSYAQLAAALQGEQSGANRDADIALQTAAAAQQRGMEALRARGEMASRFREQDYREQANAASAQDAINRFNVGRADQNAAADWERQFRQAQAMGGTAAGRANLALGRGQAAAQRDVGVGGAALDAAAQIGSIYDAQNRQPAPTRTPTNVVIQHSDSAPENISAFPDDDKEG